MSENRIPKQVREGYQPKNNKPLTNPPTGGSNVKPPSNSSKKTQ